MYGLFLQVWPVPVLQYGQHPGSLACTCAPHQLASWPLCLLKLLLTSSYLTAHRSRVYRGQQEMRRAFQS